MGRFEDARFAVVATTLKTGFGMKIYAYDPFVSLSAWEEMKDFVTPCQTVAELFATCSYISVHVPKNKDTENLINADVFAAAKKGIILVNTARGGVVDEAALYEALKNGTVRAAASDVFMKEPLDTASPLLTLPNFIATPHYAGSTEDCLRRVATKIAQETIAALFDKEDPDYRYI